MSVNNIAILSSGTDNSGINGAIRAAVRTAISSNVKIYGVKRGYLGLIDNDMSVLLSHDVSGKIGKAGCFLGTAKTRNLLTDENVEKAVKNCQSKNINGLVVIGGLGSLIASKKFIEKGIKVIGIPSTIQDNVPGTDIALGVDSAINNITECLDKIRASTSSTNRVFLVQVEGRECGSLAVHAGLTSGADFVLIPERPTQDLSEISKKMTELNLKGKNQCLAVIAAGWKPGIDELAKFLENHVSETDLSVRTTVLGYVQRGGSPSGFDRLLGTEMGSMAVKELIQGNSGKMIAFQNNSFVSVPFEECLTRPKEIDQRLIDLFNFTQ
ncbi:hypothetical protein M9Y10_012589 [Tritrichomonas musculus]|uniref:6-phosphofructokinase n=1 Tax=Tritrichomonas musculus TaxID=1915356 RepID=A0ABR2ICV5_9EUKA